MPTLIAPETTTDAKAELRAKLLNAMPDLKTTRVLARTGDHANGSWSWSLLVDVESLSRGKNADPFTAFDVSESHDTCGGSFRVLNGIAYETLLPDGVTAESLLEFCAEIFNNREKLTRGFDTEWDGGNWIGTWENEQVDENGEPLYPGVHTNEAKDYWQGRFADEAQGLNTAEVYDCNFDENRPFVLENLVEFFKADGMDKEAANAKIHGMTQSEIEDAIDEMYDNDAQSDYWYINSEKCAEWIFEKVHADDEE